MLQIASGKLFHAGVLRENELRGVLYANLSHLRDEGLSTKAASVRATNALGPTPSLIFEMVEQIEGDRAASGVVVSYGVDRYQAQFSALMSFFLGLTCNSDRDLVLRLTSGRRGLGVRTAPNALLRRVFDAEVVVSGRQAKDFAEFVEQLLALERKSFLGATRAIQTFVTGFHRMGDDLETAYTLMVASLEALAMEFDGHATRWEDVEDRKRLPVEAALKDASPEIAEGVKKAIAESEHVLLRRRFKEFTLAHLPPDFFLEGALGQLAPLGRLDLSEALDFAYETRSKYVHELRQLPDEITDARGYAERVTTVDRRTAMTFQGLYRVARAVVLEFVRRQPTKEKEPYRYILETGSATQVRFAASAWMQPGAVGQKNGKLWLEGFAETLCEAILAEGQPTMPDLKVALDKAALLLGGMDKGNRRAYVALVAGARIKLPEIFHASDQADILRKWGDLLDAPGPETLLLHMLAGMLPKWPIESHEKALMQHLRRRSKPSGFEFPRRFDAMLVVDLAERYRREGTWERAFAVLIEACENFPEFQELRDLALRANSSVDLRAEAFLLSSPSKTTQIPGEVAGKFGQVA